MASDILAFENAAKARLLARVTGLRQVVTYQGEDLEELVETLLPRSPAIALVFRGGPWEQLSGNVYRAHRSWALILIIENLRGDLARRAGTDEEAGAYEILEAAEAALAGQTLDLDIKPIRPEDTRNLWTASQAGAGFSVYGMEISTAWDVQVVEEDGDALEAIHGDFAPSDTVTESVTLTLEAE